MFLLTLIVVAFRSWEAREARGKKIKRTLNADCVVESSLPACASACLHSGVLRQENCQLVSFLLDTQECLFLLLRTTDLQLQETAMDY